MGGDANPETEDVYSSRIEDCEPMRMASLHFCRLRPNQFEKEQAWLEEDEAKPEAWYPTQCIRDAEVTQAPRSEGIPQAYTPKKTAPHTIPHQPAFVFAILRSKLRQSSATIGNHRLEQLLGNIGGSAPCHGTDLEIQKARLFSGFAHAAQPFKG